MKVNKFWSILLMLALMLGTTFSLSSCGDDDEDDQTTGIINGSNAGNGKDDSDSNGEDHGNTGGNNGGTTGQHQSHDAVDLGLSVKWATCNVGAEKPEDYGLYFAWGETTGYTQDTNDGHQFNWSNYKWCNGSNDTMTKYNNVIVGNYITLDPEDDAATANWGGSWRMPTSAEQSELHNNCTRTWTTQNGVKGYKVVGKNGNSIFLPAAGYRSNSDLNFAGSDGYYWSSSLDPWFSNYAYGLHFRSGIFEWYYEYGRLCGQSVRPVCP